MAKIDFTCDVGDVHIEQTYIRRIDGPMTRATIEVKVERPEHPTEHVTFEFRMAGFEESANNDEARLESGRVQMLELLDGDEPTNEWMRIVARRAA